MRKRNAIGILLYLLGVVLFVLSNYAALSGSPILLVHFQRVVLCGMAVFFIGTSPFIYKSNARVDTIIKFVIAFASICAVFAFNGFTNNSMA